MPGPGGPHPQTSVPIAADLLAQMGDVRAATKAVRSELRDARRELRTVVKEGRQAGPELLRRIQSAEVLGADLEKIRKTQAQTEARVRANRATGKAIRFLIGASAVKQILQGQLLDPRALSQLVFGAGESIQNAARRIFGDRSALAKVAGKFASVAPVVGEAVGSWIDAVSTISRERAEAKQIGRLREAGQLSQDEMDVFSKLEKSQFVESPMALFSRAKGAAEKISAMDPQVRRDLLTRFAREEFASLAKGGTLAQRAEGAITDTLIHRPGFFVGQLRDKAYSMLPDVMEATVAQRVDFEQQRLGRRLSDAEKAEEMRDAILTAWERLPDAARNKLLTRIADEAAKKEVKRKPDRKTAAQLRYAAEQDWAQKDVVRIAQINHARARARFALTGPIGD